MAFPACLLVNMYAKKDAFIERAPFFVSCFMLNLKPKIKR